MPRSDAAFHAETLHTVSAHALFPGWAATGEPDALDPNGRDVVSGQGSAGNVIAALCSFFVPGLGQLLQGRLMKALLQFVLAGAMWFVLLGWVIHLWSVLDAAMWKPRAST